MNAAGAPPPRLGRPFAFLWFGEAAYGIASGLMRFALGVWVYQRSGSTEDFAFVFLAATLPSLLVMPWAGSLADRVNRRYVIIGTDLVGAAMAVVLAVLLIQGRLTIPHLYFFTSFGAVLGSIRGPSYQAAVTSVLPTDALTRASGLIGLSQGLLSLVVPLAAGVLMARFGLTGIAVIQLPIMLAGAFAVFAAFANLTGTGTPAIESNPATSLVSGALNGLAPAVDFLRREPLMAHLLLYMVVHDGLLVLASTMLTPLILATHTSTAVGLVSACGAAGGIGGSLLLVVANVRKRLVGWLLTLNLCLSVCVIVAGARTSTPIWCICAFLGLLAGTASGGCAMALWMGRTPSATRGSVFSFLAVSQLVVSSLVMTAGGALVEHVFEPALANDGRWESTIGAWLGTGKGRGLGLLFVVSGLICAAMTSISLVRSRLRRLDETSSDLDAAVKLESPIVTSSLARADAARE